MQLQCSCNAVAIASGNKDLTAALSSDIVDLVLSDVLLTVELRLAMELVTDGLSSRCSVLSWSRAMTRPESSVPVSLAASSSAFSLTLGWSSVSGTSSIISSRPGVVRGDAGGWFSSNLAARPSHSKHQFITIPSIPCQATDYCRVPSFKSGFS